jgi:hypothetical protein
MKECSVNQDTWHYHTAENEQPLPLLFVLVFCILYICVLALMLTFHDKLTFKKLMVLHQLCKAQI